jgi:hypothetical protein
MKLSNFPPRIGGCVRTRSKTRHRGSENHCCCYRACNSSKEIMLRQGNRASLIWPSENSRFLQNCHHFPRLRGRRIKPLLLQLSFAPRTCNSFQGLIASHRKTPRRFLKFASAKVRPKSLLESLCTLVLHLSVGRM